MLLSYELLQQLQSQSPTQAWQRIFDYAWSVCSQSMDASRAVSEITTRDRDLAGLDHFLATAGWDLWNAYYANAPRTATRLAEWWNARSPGRAVLILDALSLREVPWLLAGAKQRGYEIHDARATGAELPPDTTPFAKALGFAQRSALSNNGAGGSHSFEGARTETTDAPWKDCADMVGAHTDWFFWHHWPDHRLHDHDDAGKGLATLTQEAAQQLASVDFWHFVERLAQGRRLVITADHGYAASGLFPDADKEQSDYLKKALKARRWSEGAQSAGDWVPPIDIMLPTASGDLLFANGRRKWRVGSGYPTLTHGGLSVLELAVPFLELSIGKKA